MIPQLLSWGSAILGLATSLNKGDKELESAKTMLDTANRAYNVLTTNSVSTSAGRSIISPIVLFEQSLIHEDFMLDVMKFINMCDIRDALTHINFQSKIDGVRIAELVDTINPNRSAGFLCMEGLEAFTPPKGSVLEKLSKQNEEDKKESKDKDSKDKESKDSDKKNGNNTTVGVDAKEFQSLEEHAPFAVGRTVNASINQNGKQVYFPLTFRQIPIPTTTANLELIFNAVKGKDGWIVRYKEWKFGGLTNPEFLCGVDQIRDEFKIRTQDMTGYYEEANARVTRNRVESLRSGRVSVNSLANSIIMTKETANRIELEIGIRFGSSKMDVIRKHVKANRICIVDIQNSIFKLYSMSSNLAETYTFQSIKAKTKKEDVGTLEALVKVLNGR